VSRVRITYRKSAIGYAAEQRATLTALGLRRRQHTVEHEAVPAVLGMVRKVRHLVSVDGIPADSPRGMELLARLDAATAPDQPQEAAP
jgi:large subunit ribosomal protein L30